MERATMIGSRIRERRVMAGLKQADLARMAGISASYLNLIEHNRRRIGGKTLNQLAQVLDVAPSLLSEGAEVALLTALRDSAGRAGAGDGAAVELDRTEEFAGRFPGWAQHLTDVARQRDELETSLKALSDRLAHDPELAGSLHEVISTVTSIRSTASILADSPTLEPQWQSRFHRNIDEDSQRLAEEAEALVRYLEGGPGADAAIQSPLDQLNAFLAAEGFHFPTLEGPGGSARVEAVVARAEQLQSDSARRMAGWLLRQYVADARALPDTLIAPVAKGDVPDPQALADRGGQSLARVFRRLGFLPEAQVGPVGLFICDMAGRMVVRKPALGFGIPRTGAGCVHWPLYQALSRPGQVLRQRLRQNDTRVLALAVSEEIGPPGIDRPALYHAHMLILPDPRDESAGPYRGVGMNCDICTMDGCDMGS